MLQNKKFNASQDHEYDNQAMSSFLINLNEKQFNPVIGREKETDRVIEVICRKDKSNPILVGDPGTGKTSIVYGLVEKIKSGKVPSKLLNKKIYSLDISLLVNNIQLFKPVFDEIIKSGDIVFIDEIHNIVGAGRQHGSMDLSNIMKPLLSNGDIICIGATTFDEYQKYFEKDAALERRFQKVIVNAPSDEDAIKMIVGLKDRYEKYHNIKIGDDAIKAAVKLSNKYITDRQLPDKAIDLIDEASSRLAIKNSAIQIEIEKLICNADYENASKLTYENLFLKAENIAEVISNRTGIPIKKLNEDDKEKLLNIESYLKDRIIGQESAVKSIADKILVSRMGLKSKNSSFLFLGPTGVGKTQCAKLLAEYLFDDAKAFIKIDMSEYMEKENVSKLIGAAPGYVGYEQGGQLTEAVRRKPYSIILFDEVEKAHPDVFNLFLQILDDNRLTDGQGRVVSFVNTIIILTSNLSPDRLGQFFRPEFLNRIDKVISFNSLSFENAREITLLEFDKFNKENQIRLLPKEGFVDWFTKEFYEERYGARSIQRAIEDKVKPKIAKKMLEKPMKQIGLSKEDIDL